MTEKIIASGKLFELVQATQSDGRVFEVARRAPGVRVIIADTAKRSILLTKEFRSELDSWDYRLPGGKVFDSLEEYETHRKSGEDIVAVAITKAIAESHEEAGIDVTDVELYKKCTLGATVEWDLYVFASTGWQEHADGQKLEIGENVQTDNWFSYEKVEEMIYNGEMQEERIALVLLQWIKQQGSPS